MKAADVFENIYYTMPASTEADAAYAELKKKLPSVPPPTALQLKTRARRIDGQAPLSRRGRGSIAGWSTRTAPRRSLPCSSPLAGRTASQVVRIVTRKQVPHLGRRRERRGKNAQRLLPPWSSLRGAANDNESFYSTVDELAAGPLLRVRGSSRRCSPPPICTWCITSTIRRSIHSANRSSVFPRARARFLRALESGMAHLATGT